MNDFIKDVTVVYKDELVNVVRKYLINGDSYFFKKINIKDNEYNIKNDLASVLNIHSNNIIIVGSAKLGFSIKPTRETDSYDFKPFRVDYDTDHDIEESDIDIAIVDSDLFENKAECIYKYLRGYELSMIFQTFDDCRKTRFYHHKGKKYNKRCFDDYSKYMLMGWLRPDKMPKDYELSPELEVVQHKYNKLYNRKINIGIYKSWFYFERYNIQNLEKMQQYIKSKGA